MDKKKVEEILQGIGYEAGINGREEYLNSVVLVPLIFVEGEYQVILEKRELSIRQGGEICFPGGKIDLLDLTLEDTALRETWEELGIPKEKVKLVGRLDTVIAPLGAIIDAFVGIVEIDLSDLALNKVEVEELILLPLTFFLNVEPKQYKLRLKVHPSYRDLISDEEIVLFPAKELGIPETYWKPWGHFQYSTYVYQTPRGTIWGITAKLILDLVRRIKERGNINEY